MAISGRPETPTGEVKIRNSTMCANPKEIDQCFGTVNANCVSQTKTKGNGMLVLSRKKDQSIQIGSDITIRIFQIKGNSVRIGIQAPEEVRILRGELAWFDEPIEVEFPSSQTIIPDQTSLPGNL